MELCNESTGKPAKRIKISFEASPHEVRQNLLKLVTVHGRPFSLLDDDALQKIIKPVVRAFPKQDQFAVSSSSLKDDVFCEAARIRDLIKKELKQVRLFIIFLNFSIICLNFIVFNTS